MKPQDQIKSIAQLDGWTHVGYSSEFENLVMDDPDGRRTWLTSNIPPYLTSRDAICDAISKQSYQVQYHVSTELNSMMINREVYFPFLAKPQQLCEALLRATGKWIP